MPAKPGAKAIWISGEVHALIKNHVKTMPDRPGITRFIEKIAVDAIEGRPSNLDKATTEDLVKVLFGSPERVAELYDSWKNQARAYETLGKYLQALVPVQRHKKKT